MGCQGRGPPLAYVARATISRSNVRARGRSRRASLGLEAELAQMSVAVGVEPGLSRYGDAPGSDLAARDARRASLERGLDPGSGRRVTLYRGG